MPCAICVLPTSDSVVLLDSSAAVSLAAPGHRQRRTVIDAVAGHRLGLAGHAEFETYSVLTRLPPPLRLSPAVAQQLIEANFPETRRLDPQALTGLLAELARVGIAGGQVYDALVAAAARAHQLALVTCDARAAATYRALGVSFRLV